MSSEKTRDISSSISRRSIISAGGAAALTGLAGCSALPGGGSVPGIGGSSSLDYTQWAYAPDVLDREHYTIYGVEPKAIAEAEDEFDEATYERLESVEETLEPTGLDFDEIESLTTIQGHYIFTSSEFESEEELLDELDDSDAELDDDDEIGEFTVVYDDEDDLNQGAAVNGNTVILTGTNLGTQENNAEDVLEAIIETKNGEEDKYTDENEDFNLLAEKLGQGTIVTGRTHEEFEGEPEVDLQSGDTVSGLLNGADPQFGDQRYESYTFDGSSGDYVTIEMTSPGDAYLFLLGPDGNVVERDDDGGGGLDSQIQRGLRQDGVYEIRASHYSGENLGQGMSYELTFSKTSQTTSGGRGTTSLGLEGERARGSVINIDGDEATREWVFVYDDESDVDTEELEDRFSDAQDESERLDEYDDVSVSKDGRAAVLTATVDTDSIMRPFSFV